MVLVRGAGRTVRVSSRATHEGAQSFASPRTAIDTLKGHSVHLVSSLAAFDNNGSAGTTRLLLNIRTTQSEIVPTGRNPHNRDLFSFNDFIGIEQKPTSLPY